MQSGCGFVMMASSASSTVLNEIRSQLRETEALEALAGAYVR